MAITAAKVLNILTRKGADGVFETYASKTFDPDTGQVTYGDRATHTHKILPPYPPSQAFGQRDQMVTGDSFASAEALTIVSASGLTFTPGNGMRLTFGGVTYTIVGVSPLYVQSTIVAYWSALRGKAQS